MKFSKKFFLHIGAGKTGSTSLQKFLYNNKDIFEKYNFYFPKTGQIFPGIISHHNISYELNNDSNYEPLNGTYKELLQEVSSINKNIIISSEDFIDCLNNKSKLSKINNDLTEIGFEVIFIIYIRFDYAYLRSIFFELKKNKKLNYLKLFIFLKKAFKNGYYTFDNRKIILNHKKLIYLLKQYKINFSSINYERNKKDIFKPFLTEIFSDEKNKVSFDKFNYDFKHYNKFKRNFFQPLRLFSYFILTIAGYFFSLIVKKKLTDFND